MKHEDLTADTVIGELHQRAANVVRMDTGDFPAGQWLWLQDEVGVEIAAGIAELLMSGGRR